MHVSHFFLLFNCQMLVIPVPGRSGWSGDLVQRAVVMDYRSESEPASLSSLSWDAGCALVKTPTKRPASSRSAPLVSATPVICVMNYSI